MSSGSLENLQAIIFLTIPVIKNSPGTLSYGAHAGDSGLSRAYKMSIYPLLFQLFYVSSPFIKKCQRPKKGSHVG